MEEINFYASLPKKRVAAAALFFNERHEILILKPVYQAGWVLPGGVVEKDESPRHACIREIEEELGLQVTITRLLCVDYKVPQAKREEGFEIGETIALTSARIWRYSPALSDYCSTF